MEEKHYDKVHKINCLSSDLDALYHQAAFKLGVADSVMIVLYTLHDKGDECLLYDIYSESGISKQTINSAIRKLEQDEIVFLEQTKGKAKLVRLTQKGKTYMNQTAGRLFEAECRVFGTWTEEEFTTYLHLMEKYNRGFRAEIEKLTQKSQKGN